MGTFTSSTEFDPNGLVQKPGEVKNRLLLWPVLYFGSWLSTLNPGLPLLVLGRFLGRFLLVMFNTIRLLLSRRGKGKGWNHHLY